MTDGVWGAGHATAEADATASLLAAHFSGGKSALVLAEGTFDEAAALRQGMGAGDGRGYTADTLSRLLAGVPAAIGLKGKRAIACGPGESADVLVYSQGDVIAARIEIKAQLTRPEFKHIQNADWVREQTDYLGHLLSTDAEVREWVSQPVRELILEAYDQEPGWNPASLWLADVGGVTNRGTRHAAGIYSPADLGVFLTRKYILHITLEGLRLHRLADIPAVRSALAGQHQRVLKREKKSDLIVRTRGDNQVPRRGAIHLTYFLGQKNRPVGGHHMHEPFFQGATALLHAG